MSRARTLVFGSAVTVVLTAFAAPSAELAHAIENRGATPALAPGTAAPAVIRAQILLDRARFSPGEIDGKYGGDLGVAVTGYQRAHNLTADGVIGPEMWQSIDADTRPLMTTYTVTAADVRGPFGPIPADVQAQAQMKWMGYASAAEGLAEKFHVSTRLLQALNPSKVLDTVGASLVVPAVERGLPRRALRVVVSKSKRTVTAYGAGDRILAEYPATIGGEHDPLPIGDWKITVVQRYPWFNYDPAHFWNASPDEATAKLPPGPRNPAGVVWMGLSKSHYGIHGTPDPGRVRHGESYGCIRLTNWDASDLARMVVVGTLAILED